MGKNKGIWLVIAVILLFGTVITLSTRKFISTKENISQSELITSGNFDSNLPAPASAAGPAAMSENVESSVEGNVKREVRNQSVETASKKEAETAQANEGDDVGEGAALEAAKALSDFSETDDIPQETVLSPLENPAVTESYLSFESGAYRERLEALDEKIKNMRAESTDSTMYAMKTMAEKEYMLWDAELNTVYQAVIYQLDEDTAAQLVLSEREWIKERDSKASEAAKKYSGGTMEGLEYTATLASETRQRTYDLVEQYGDMLD